MEEEYEKEIWKNVPGVRNLLSAIVYDELITMELYKNQEGWNNNPNKIDPRLMNEFVSALKEWMSSIDFSKKYIKEEKDISVSPNSK